MPHQMCRECHRLVSETAKACPYCGISGPAATEGPFAHLRPYASALLLGLGLVWIGGLWMRPHLEQLARPILRPVRVVPLDPNPGFQSLALGVRLGAPLFGRTDRAYVGRITSLDCPRQAVGVVGVACLQVEFADGRRAWVDRSTANAQYLTPRNH